MKQLQTDFTTPEQSKRLLELGVPADSADCYYSRMQHEEFENPRVCYMQYFNHTLFHTKTFIYLPCWTVGRLIEICKICEPKKDYEQLCDEMKECQNYCVLILSHIIANLPIINFSKLEE